MLTPYAYEGRPPMHVLPLPFGIALAVLPSAQARALVRPKAAQQRQSGPPVRDQIRTESRYAEFRQRFV